MIALRRLCAVIARSVAADGFAAIIVRDQESVSTISLMMSLHVESVAAVLFLSEPITIQLALAGLLMATGVWLHLTEDHGHEHAHDLMEHAHPHVHDAHHQHEHGPDDPPGEPHTHTHRHEPLRHTHPHVPDIHHVHRH